MSNKVKKEGKWFEFTLSCGGRPLYPEDRTVILKAESMTDAIDIFNQTRGDRNIHGDIEKIRQVYYVMEFEDKD